MELPKSTPGRSGRQNVLTLDDPNLTRKQLSNLRYRIKKSASNEKEPRKKMSLDDDGLTEKQLYQLKHRIANFEKRRENSRIWRENNKSKVKDYNKRYYQDKLKNKVAELVGA
jgi:hypothetical protein